MTDEATGALLALRDQLVTTALAWERAFGVAPAITSTLAEFDAARLVGMSLSDYSAAMQGVTAVQRGFDFRYAGLRYQVKACRPSGKPGSFVTRVPKASNFDWDVLVWLLYDRHYDLVEAWRWPVAAYRTAFEFVPRLTPAQMRAGERLR
jgi:hypothetical protein